MDLTRIIVVLGISTALTASSGDRAREPGRVPAGFAATRAAGGAPSSWPSADFVVFGWVSPPVESTSIARVSEMSEAGMSLAVPAFEDSGRRVDNLDRLDLGGPRGIRCILWDRRFMNVVPDSAPSYSSIDSIVADYHDYPAFFGYYLGDEPPRESFGLLAKFYRAVRARDPAHDVWNNLFGRSGFVTREAQVNYTNEFLDSTGAKLICNAQFDFLRTGDRNLFTENAATTSAIARERGIPFWGIVQLIEHIPYRPLTPGELKWQVSTLLAYGAHGIGYFTYWSPRPDPKLGWGDPVIDFEGRRTYWFPVLESFNPLVHEAGNTLAGLNWLGTVHAGSVPRGGTRFTAGGWVDSVEGRAALGFFSDPNGTPYVLVTNADSLSAQTIGLSLPGTDRACILSESAKSWSLAPCVAVPATTLLRLQIPPGSFALLRLEGDTVGGIPGGTAPALRLSPSPASGSVDLAIARIGDRGQVEILDATGRRAWGKRLDPGDTRLVWRGEREGGGSSPPGLYFARVEDTRGFRVERLVWLGAR